MKYLVVSTNTADVAAYLDEEIRRVDELRAAGVITDVWLKSDQSGAVLMLECAGPADANAAMHTLPMVRNDATTFELIEIVDLDSVRSR